MKTAKEAREITNKNSSICNLIETAATEGGDLVMIPSWKISEEIKEELVSLGYEVNPSSMKTMPSITKISW